MTNFDHKKFLFTDERVMRIMIAEVRQEKPWKHKYKNSGCGFIECEKCGADKGDERFFGKIYCSIPDPIDTDFCKLAFELRDKVNGVAYHNALALVLVANNRYLGGEFATPTEMICAALMAWPESEEK
jgi:hypothetical protein